MTARSIVKQWRQPALLSIVSIALSCILITPHMAAAQEGGGEPQPHHEYKRKGSIKITDVAPAKTIAVGSTVVVQATVDDKDGNPASAVSVDWYRDGASVGTSTTDNQGHAGLSWTPDNDSSIGSHSVEAKVSKDDYDPYTASTEIHIKRMVVRITGPSDVAKGCNGTFCADVHGGQSPYTYSWTTSKASTHPTTQCVTLQNLPLHETTLSVTVNDANNSQADATHTVSGHKNKTVEEKTLRATTHTGRSRVSQYVQGNGGSIPFSVTGSLSWNDTLSVSGSVNIKDVITAKLGYKADSGVTAGVQMTATARNTDPNKQYALYVRPRYLDHAGTWEKYNCQGLADHGTWFFLKHDGWIYSAQAAMIP